MRKIKILIFMSVIVLSLCGMSFAYNVGDVLTAGISGYCKQCNQDGGVHTATGVTPVAGKTAAVSYTGSTRNPDLKYGTVVYVESIGKSYVIIDVGSNKRGGQVGVEPFCSSHGKEENSITTPNGKPTTIRILYIPNESTVKKNALAGLEFLESGKATSSANGQSTLTSGSNLTANRCSCGGIISSEYYATPDNTHYRVCTVNPSHQHDIVVHSFINGKCSVCGLRSGVKISYNTKVLSANLQQSSFTSFSKTGFSDLAAGHWAEADVLAMKNLGIVSGRDDGSLGTNDSVTTEEFIVMLSNVARKKGLANIEGSVYLSNQLRSEWSYGRYEYLAQVLGKRADESNELGKKELAKILGTGGSAYKKPITREKAAYIMGALGFEGTTSVNLLHARDWEQVGSEYKKRINALSEKRIFRGSDNGDGTVNVNPQNAITRVEAIVLMNRLYNAL